jgi:hypothetical protein
MVAGGVGVYFLMARDRSPLDDGEFRNTSFQ